MIDPSQIFIFFEQDEVLVCLDNVAIARPISEGDLDLRTGSLQKHIPADAQTRIDLKVGGWVYVSETVQSINARLAVVAQLPCEEAQQ